MTDEQAQAIIERLDKIVQLLEEARPKPFTFDMKNMHIDADRMDGQLRPHPLFPPTSGDTPR